ncbi:ribosome production factor 1-like isoform X2 [Asparagus officinalis]|uniref:ribosome production factor 1-like isoform X2 n=1 Tax=Asparagus officinalis TaxID=4686 RepID=UPI00098E7B2B|nr:ribosome production factor 1-like isoform X2 [Asparagus officinalis]
MAKDKRKRSQSLDLDEEPSRVESNKEKKPKVIPSLIKNKDKRSQVHAKLKKEKKIEKRKQAKARDAAHKRALELGEEPPVKQTPRTIENAREPDETVCQPDDEEECGPRFTLKLRSLQHGTFDTKGGEYEWVHKGIRDSFKY